MLMHKLRPFTRKLLRILKRLARNTNGNWKLNLYDELCDKLKESEVCENLVDLGRLTERSQKKIRVRWGAPRSVDVVGYKLYWAIGHGVDYDSDFAELGNVTEVVLPDGVPSFPPLSGTIQLGCTAFNDTGNESEMTKYTAFFDQHSREAGRSLPISH